MTQIYDYNIVFVKDQYNVTGKERISADKEGN